MGHFSRRRVEMDKPRRSRRPGRLLWALSLLLGTAAVAVAQTGAVDGEWRSYAADLASTRYVRTAEQK